jgi:hypothetical protein
MTCPILDPVILETITEGLQNDARLVSLLSQTCKAYRDSFPTTYAMHDLQDWLIWQEAMGSSWIRCKDTEVFNWAKITFTGKPRTWLLKADCGRKSVMLFDIIGVIRVGKCSAKLTIIGEARYTMHKDSFYGIQDLETLKACMKSHAILCHEMPENLPRLPATVVHRHRDTVPWTFARAFYVWRATLRGYETWNGGRSNEPDEVDMAHRIVYFS